MPPRISPEEYLRRCTVVHQNLYEYDPASFGRVVDSVRIRCATHGWFRQRLQNHLNGCGCPKCAGLGVDWIARFRAVHGATYDYSHFMFEGYKSPGTIVCAAHGPFEQTPDNHYRGKQGCPKCGRARSNSAKRLSAKEFLRRARGVHGDQFAYDMSRFDNMLDANITITCPTHGKFDQSAVNHLAGKIGCRKCNNMKSAPEDAIAAFLSRFTTVVQRDRTLIAPKEIDIYMPEHNLAVEYCGMYWHSHGDREDERKNKMRHAEKHRLCAAKGVRLITLYETEWLERPETVKRLLRNAIGQSRGKLMARKCELRKPTVQEARAFYEKYHPQGGAGTGDQYGLYHKGKLVACMRFTFGSNDRGHSAKERQWTLSRYATRLPVAGAASRLFKAFVQEHNPSEVKSFSDNRLFGGGMYEQLGFELEADVPADYQVWSLKAGLRPKSHYQRRLIPARLQEHGVDDHFDPATDTRTEAEITYEMGARRIFDCGKKRWLWTQST